MTSIIAVDFDGTIASYADGWEGWDVVGEPIPGALEFLKALHKAGHRIMIFSARARAPEGKKAIEEWIVEYGLDDIIEGVTHEKLPYFSLIVDDRAIRFEENFRDILKFILKFRDDYSPDKLKEYHGLSKKT